MDTEEARQLIEQERRERAEKCRKGIQEVLELYKCRIEVSVILRAGQVIPQIDILPNE